MLGRLSAGYRQHPGCWGFRYAQGRALAVQSSVVTLGLLQPLQGSPVPWACEGLPRQGLSIPLAARSLQRGSRTLLVPSCGIVPCPRVEVYLNTQSSERLVLPIPQHRGALPALPGALLSGKKGRVELHGCAVSTQQILGHGCNCPGGSSWHNGCVSWESQE